MDITIDKNIPLPAERQVWGANAKYPIATMEVGDSFFVPTPPGLDTGTFARRVRAAVVAHKKLHRHKDFTTRIRMKGDAEGVRVWRKPDTSTDMAKDGESTR